jgi:protein SCO1
MNRVAVSKPVQWGVWGVLFLVIAAIVGLFIRERLTTKKSERPVYSVLRDFSLTNQNGVVVTLDDLKGKVWVGDIIFTRCPGPCRRMTRDMARLQDLWPKDAPVRFVSLTSDPEFDTPALLKRYADEHKAEGGRWYFLTGTKEAIVDLAVDGMKLTRIEKEERERESVNDLFIHSTIFVVVDKRGQVRATVETNDANALTRCREVVDELLRER